jgi:hypothetical protein
VRLPNTKHGYIWENAYRCFKVVRRILRYAGGGDCYMVDDDVHHKEHSTSMDLITQLLEILSGPKTIIELSDIGDPVPVIGVPICCTRSIIVLVYWTNPNSGEAHGLYVVQVRSNGLPGAATEGLLCYIARCELREGRRESEPIRDDPLDVGSDQNRKRENGRGRESTGWMERVFADNTYWYIDLCFHSSAVAPNTGEREAVVVSNRPIWDGFMDNMTKIAIERRKRLVGIIESY